MDEKRQKKILDKIRKAQQRRQVFGLSSQQVNSIAQQQQQDSALPTIMNKQKVLRLGPKPRPPIMNAPFRSTAEAVNTGEFTIFVSGGIGDVITLESFFTEEQRRTLTTVFYATNKYHFIEPLFRSMPNYPALKNHVTVWADFSKFWCFYSKEDCLRKLIAQKQSYPQSLIFAQDYSILPRFEDIKAGKLRFTGSSLLKHKVASLDELILPDKFITLCPFSTDKRIKTRDFDQSDWQITMDYLRKKGMKGVVLNEGHDTIPSEPELINLSNKATLPQAIEIMKLSMGYLGIDSALSVLAAQFFRPEEMTIKSHNGHCYDNLVCYYAPHRSFDFVVREIKLSPQLHL
jgi:hypothetical protein